MIWLFITIGFIGAFCLTLSSIIAMTKCVKARSFEHIVWKSRLLLAFANFMFLIYALGISLLNHNSIIFWNSVPTWVGSLIPLVLNLIMVIGKIKSDKKNNQNPNN